MAVDKTLEIDFSNLTPEGIDQINGQLSKIEKEVGTSKAKPGQPITDPIKKRDEATQKRLDELTKQIEFDSISQKGKDNLKEKIFGKTNFGNLVSFGKNPLSFIQGTVTRLIPFIGTALAVTGVIAEFIKRVDDFQKEFTNNVDGRINLFRDKETQVRVQAGLQQIIITTASGSAEPRDAYNTFTVFNEDQARIEADFRLTDTSGVN